MLYQHNSILYRAFLIIVLVIFAPVDALDCFSKVPENSPCIPISGWRDFRIILQAAEGDIILCPFTINTGGRQYKVVLNKAVNIFCLREGECKIHGSGKHLQFGELTQEASQAQVLLRGFEFQSLDFYSIFSLGKGNPHSLCNCRFIGNTYTAIVVETSSHLKINACTFENIQTPGQATVSAIMNTGTVELSGSTFSKNQSPGSVIYSKSGSQLNMLQNSFIDNSANSMIQIEESTILIDIGYNVVSGDSNCNGIKSPTGCIAFITDAPTSSPSVTASDNPSSEPTIIPSSSPSSKPTSAPSDLPTVTASGAPSLDPSTVPSGSPTVTASDAPSLSILPSSQPSLSVEPSLYPSTSSNPTSLPSVEPSYHPTTSMSPSAEPTFIPSVSHVPTVSSFPSMAPSSYKTTTWFKDIVSKSKWGCTPLPEPVPACTSVTDWENLRAIMEQEEGVVIFCPFEVVKTNSTYPPITLKHEATFLCATNNQCIISGGGPYIRIERDNEIGGFGILLQGFMFTDATSTAVKVATPNTFNAPMNTFCHCSFLNNEATRGAAVLVEARAKLTIQYTLFKENDARFGGSIYSYGDIYVYESTFRRNSGNGAAIYAKSASKVTLRGNKVMMNKNGLSLILQGSMLEDQGGNTAAQNHVCNGVYNTLYPQWCINFKPKQIDDGKNLSPAPTPGTPKGTPGYFNYDPADATYGPSNWGNIHNTNEFNRWKELDRYLHHNLHNECVSTTRQGPIDVCDTHQYSGTCWEYHQIRPVHGDYKLDNEHVKMQILPGKLRIKYDTRPNGPLMDKTEMYTDAFKKTPQPPHADFAHYWNWHIQTNHVDVKIPSEHTICGKRYVGELTIWHLHPQPDHEQRRGQDVIVMSVLIDIHPQGQANLHFQKAINKWKAVFEENDRACENRRRLQEMYPTNDMVDISEDSAIQNLADIIDEIENYEEAMEVERQKQRRNEEVGKNKGWSPYNGDIIDTLYFYAYHGSLTEPPCSDFVAWRVMDRPMYISRNQLEQLKDLLFNHRDSNCQRTTAQFDESVARPTQNLHVDHRLYRCTRDNYVSDREKQYMRELTGDPHWCC